MQHVVGNDEAIRRKGDKVAGRLSGSFWIILMDFERFYSRETGGLRRDQKQFSASKEANEGFCPK
jgi:hypothetical protein